LDPGHFGPKTRQTPQKMLVQSWTMLDTLALGLKYLGHFGPGLKCPGSKVSGYQNI